MEWLRCEDSSNLFKTPKSVHCCQTRKLKSLIKLVVISQNNLQSIEMFRLPPLPPLTSIRPIHLQILTHAPLFSHFPSKNLNKYTSSPKIPSKCLHDLAKSYHCTTTPHHLFNTSYL